MMKIVTLGSAVALGLVLLAAPVAGQTQDNGSAGATIGSPMLRNFELKGTRTTPPAEQQPAATAQPAAPAPAAERPAEQPRAPARAARTAPAAPVPQPVRTAPPASAEAPTMGDILARARAEAPLEIPPATADALPEESLPQAPEPAAPLVQTPPAPEAALPGRAMWGALALALLGLLGFAYWRSRRTALADAKAGAGAALARAPLAEAEPAAASVRPAPAAPRVDESQRPWIEIEFKPERVVATATEATVHFELIVKNMGESEARNVRIQAKMFNPSANQKQDINAFFATPAPADGEGLSIPPKLAARFRSSVVMPKDQVREVQVQGRSLFIPTVGINILYAWGEGRKGQTCKSYVVGTEKQADSDRMGPFRLDLGPRVYRHVGGRSLELARAV